MERRELDFILGDIHGKVTLILTTLEKMADENEKTDNRIKALETFNAKLVGLSTACGTVAGAVVTFLFNSIFNHH